VVSDQVRGTVHRPEPGRQHRQHQSYRADRQPDPQRADGLDPQRVALQPVVPDPGVAVPAQRPGDALRGRVLDVFGRQPDLQPDRTPPPTAAQFAQAEVNSGHEGHLLGEQVRGRQLEHVFRPLQLQLDDLVLAPSRSPARDLRHSGPPRAQPGV
jgi:hypothetical protein